MKNLFYLLKGNFGLYLKSNVYLICGFQQIQIKVHFVDNHFVPFVLKI